MVFSFLNRKKQVDVAPFVRRIIDLTTPNKPTPDDVRFELRYNRTLPVLLHPWVGDRPDLQRTSIGLTKDLSDRGLGLIAVTDLAEEQYVITIWPEPNDTEEPYHFIATRRSTRKISLGLWASGFEFDELLNSAYPKWLAPLNDLAIGALVPDGWTPATC